MDKQEKLNKKHKLKELISQLEDLRKEIDSKVPRITPLDDYSLIDKIWKIYLNKTNKRHTISSIIEGLKGQWDELNRIDNPYPNIDEELIDMDAMTIIKTVNKIWKDEQGSTYLKQLAFKYEKDMFCVWISESSNSGMHYSNTNTDLKTAVLKTLADNGSPIKMIDKYVESI